MLLVVLLAAAALVPRGAAQAQDASEREATERRLEELREQISESESRLSETEEEEEESRASLEELEREIAIRSELIETFEERLQQLNQERDSIQTSIISLEEDLETLRSQYRERARHAYMYGRLHDLALILSAESINQMLIRVRYLRRFTEQRRDRLSEIREATEELETQRIELEDARANTQDLLSEAEQERRRLSNLEQERRQLIAQLSEEREDIQQELSERRQREEELVEELRNIVEAEAERGRERASESESSAAEFAELSGSFRDNQGRLPWPAGGVVLESFGENVHPVYGTRTPNYGVLVATRDQESVNSVFEGHVTLVDVMPEYGRFVIVQHGEYQSFYGNLSMLYVEEGDRLEPGDVIGRAGTEAEPQGNALFFGIFQEGTPLDPTEWLQSR